MISQLPTFLGGFGGASLSTKNYSKFGLVQPEVRRQISTDFSLNQVRISKEVITLYLTHSKAVLIQKKQRENKRL